MIKLIIFDLDNTLVDLSEVHRKAFTDALTYSYGLYIEPEYHAKYLEALPTKEKLKKLGIPENNWKSIIEAKQESTLKEVDKLKVNYELLNMIEELIVKSYKLYCASNSISPTVERTLSKLGLYEYVPFLGSDQVCHPKPSPEIYYKCMAKTGVKIDETLIIEDSQVGEKAINNSGSHKLMVKNASDLNLDKILNRIREIENV